MDHFQRSARNTFAALNLERSAEQRDNDAWLAQQLDSPQARFLPLHDSACLVSQDQPQHPLLLKENPVPEQQPVFLGNGAETSLNYFSVALPEKHSLLNNEYQLLRLREAASAFNAHYAGLCAYALAIQHWQQRHQYCGSCGQQQRIRSAGHRLQCSNKSCRKQTFPRIDPAMIVLVTYNDQCLLGRQSSWPAKRYSSLAGFVEPGESLEDAVRREVMEEAGVSLAEIYYHSSQPWPFPASIMLGFTATASSDYIAIGDELEHACWWRANDIETAVATGKLLLPYQLSISWQLLADWYQQQTGTALAELSISHAHQQS